MDNSFKLCDVSIDISVVLCIVNEVGWLGNSKVIGRINIGSVLFCFVLVGLSVLLDWTQRTSLRAGEVCKCRCCAIV